MFRLFNFTQLWPRIGWNKEIGSFYWSYPFGVFEQYNVLMPKSKKYMYIQRINKSWSKQFHVNTTILL